MKKIALSSLSFTFLLCLILSSCALSSDVVSNKKIQKRKYQKGLFLANKSKKVKKDSKSAEYTFMESNDLDNILDERSNSSLDVGIKEEKSSGKNEKRDCRKETIHQIKHINKLARELANEEKLVKANMSGIETQNKLDTNYEAAILAASSVIKNDLSDLLNLGLKLLILGLILFVLGLLLGTVIWALGNIFFLLSSIAWISGLVCIILHYIDVYDL